MKIDSSKILRDTISKCPGSNRKLPEKKRRPHLLDAICSGCAIDAIREAVEKCAQVAEGVPLANAERIAQYIREAFNL